LGLAFGPALFFGRPMFMRRISVAALILAATAVPALAQATLPQTSTQLEQSG
jgi:hypothetical protein